MGALAVQCPPAVTVCGSSTAPPHLGTAGTDPCRARVHRGLSAARSHLPRCPCPACPVPTGTILEGSNLPTAGAGGRDGWHRARPEPSLQMKSKNNPHPPLHTHTQFRKILFPSKSHENTSNASDIPFVIIPGELYGITSPHRGDLNKCPNLLPDPSPSVGGTAGSPQDVPVPAVPVSVRRAWLHLVLPSRACPMPSL